MVKKIETVLIFRLILLMVVNDYSTFFVAYILYSLDQMLRLLFISSPKFVWRLLIPVAAREAILRD